MRMSGCSMQKNGKITLLAPAVVLAGCLLITGCGNQKQAGGPHAQAGPPEVAVMTVKTEHVKLTTELPGRTSAHLVAEIRPQVSGIIQKRLFTEGADVKAGDVLYQIDPAGFEAAHASARASQARAEATLGTLKLRAERYSDLVRSQAVSQQDNDDAQAALKQAEAEVAAAKAAVEIARINLAYTSIKAPISGRIGRSAVTEGALVTAGQPNALSTIQKLDTVYVDMTQSSAELLKLRQNLASGLMKKGSRTEAKVKLLLEDGAPYPLPGTLKFSEVTVDQSTGSVTLRAVFPNPEQTLLPGMFVRAILEEGVQENAILIPQRGVTRNPDGEAMVMTVGAEEKVEPRAIKVVRTVGDRWLLRTGVKAGDRIILEGLQRARPGTQVKAVPFGDKPQAMPAAGSSE